MSSSSEHRDGGARESGTTKRALLIGSQTYGLTGCDGDVDLMAGVLERRGFDTSKLKGDAASRAGIVAGLDRLVADTRPGDAVVVFYSGHGGRVARPDADERKRLGLTTHYHFLVPFDIDASEPHAFRGFLSEEMTLFQQRIADAFVSRGATPNVTTILDCCHSGYFARAADMRQKSVDLSDKVFRLRGIREHAHRLGEEAASLAGTTNPYVVRLVACQPEQSAFEMPARDGRHGALTDAFVSVLEAAGEQPLAWSVVADLVRRRVRAVVPEQRPDVEGPTAQALFSTEPVEQTTMLPIDVANGVPGIEAAALLGVDVGDELRLVAPGRTQGVGTAVVSRLEGSRAVLSVTLLTGGDAATGSIPQGVVAVRARSRRPRFPVALDDTSPGDELHLLVEQSTSLRVAVAGEPALARVVHREHGLAVLDPLDAPWRTQVVPSDRAGIRRTLAVLEEIAIGRRLLDLSSGVGASELTNPIDVVFGVVEEGVLRPLERHGQRLRAGELVSLTVRNASAAHVFAWVFDVGVSGRASLLTNSASGVLLGAAGSAEDTAMILSASGRALTWPRDVPAGAAPGAHDSARHETFVVVLADRRGDLSSLASPARTARGEAPEGDLATLLGRGSMTTREVAEEVDVAEPLRYRVEEVSFFLCPP